MHSVKEDIVHFANQTTSPLRAQCHETFCNSNLYFKNKGYYYIQWLLHFSLPFMFYTFVLRLGNVSSPLPLMHLLNKTRPSINLVIQKHHGSHSERQRVPSSPIDVKPHNVVSAEVYCSVHFPHPVRSCNIFIKKRSYTINTDIKQNIRPSRIFLFTPNS